MVLTYQELQQECICHLERILQMILVDFHHLRKNNIYSTNIYYCEENHQWKKHLQIMHKNDDNGVE